MSGYTNIRCHYIRSSQVMLGNKVLLCVEIINKHVIRRIDMEYQLSDRIS